MVMRIRGFFRLVLLISSILAIGLPAQAQETPFAPFDSCIEIDHSHGVNGSPSSARFLVRFFNIPNGVVISVDNPPMLDLNVTGASGPVSGSGPIDESGTADLEIPLFQYGTHTISEGWITQDQTRVPVDTSQIGDGGTFEVSSSQPTCDPSDLAVPPEPVAEETTTTSTTTTTTSTTTTTTQPVPETTQAPPSTVAPQVVAAPTETEGNGFPWPGLLLGSGGLLILAGGYLATRDDETKDCSKLYELWQSAEARARLAEQSLEEARQYLEERKAHVAELEAELAKLKAAAGNSLTEGGKKYHLIAEGKVTAEGLKEITSSVADSLAHAKSAEASAAQSVSDWEARVVEYRQAADDAKAAYEACVGVSTGSTGGTSTSTGAGDTVTTGAAAGGMTAAPEAPPGETTVVGGVVEEPKKVCEEGTRKTEDLDPEPPVTTIVDFSIIVEVEPESKRQVETAEALAFDLRRLYGELDLAGTMLGAHGAGDSLAGAVGGLHAGNYVTAAGGLAEGTASGLLAGTGAHVGSGDMQISIPTSPQEALTEVLEATARLGALVADKVGKWMKMNQLYRVRLRFFTQTLTAKPFQVMECRNNQWVCAEKGYEISISKLQLGPQPNPRSFKLEGVASRHAFERHLATLAQRAKQEIDKGVKQRKKFEDEHQRGPC